jgi:hypothetical protein
MDNTFGNYILDNLQEAVMNSRWVCYVTVLIGLTLGGCSVRSPRRIPVVGPNECVAHPAWCRPDEPPSFNHVQDQ